MLGLYAAEPETAQSTGSSRFTTYILFHSHSRTHAHIILEKKETAESLETQTKRQRCRFGAFLSGEVALKGNNEILEKETKRKKV